jgi:hypothetical protein
MELAAWEVFKVFRQRKTLKTSHAAGGQKTKKKLLNNCIHSKTRQLTFFFMYREKIKMAA